MSSSVSSVAPLPATKRGQQQRWRQRQRRSNALFYIFAIPFTLIWLIPVFGALLTSIRTHDDIFYHGYLALPQPFTLEPYQRAWTDGNVSTYLLNTFIITIPSIIAGLFLSSLAAYALARIRFRGSRIILILFICGLMIPYQMILLPIFQLSNFLGLYNTFSAVILVHTAFQIGFCGFVLRNFMRVIPSEILESARIDGCHEFGIYWRIALPLTLPAFAALATLEFTWIFNDFLWPLVLLQDDGLKPITAGLATLMGQYNTDWNVVIAGSIIASIPTLLVFTVLQRYFIQGLTLGSTK